MRLSSLASARPAFYDRNSTSSLSVYNADVAPHAETSRVSVTVAAGKKHTVEALTLQVLRTSAGSVIGYAAGRAYIYPSGVSQSKLAECFLYNNTAYQEKIQIYSPGITLYPGDNIALASLDTTTGGTVTYLLVYKATIYDA